MSGADFDIDIRQIKRLSRKFQSLSTTQYKRGLDLIEGLIEAQTKERIRNEKRSPDGKRWQNWSKNYHGGKELLLKNKHLFRSILTQKRSDGIEVGSPMKYASTHQFGDDSRNIPARSFLGLSRKNRKEIQRELGLMIKKNLV